MSFDAATLSLIEDALSECFQYHKQLDDFLLRCKIPQKILQSARQNAEARQQITARYDKAPKRYVVQALFHELQASGQTGDLLFANIVTALVKMKFSNASPQGIEAIRDLQAKIQIDRQERKNIQEQEKINREKSAQEEMRIKEESWKRKLECRDKLRDKFEILTNEPNTQTRGYLFETFLIELFEYEKLDPRKSFRNTGEQIDGSFTWRNRTFLLEAKWVAKPVAGAEFGAFQYKISGKTVDTRGLYISINGYSPEAIKGMNAKGALQFVCIDGAHIMRALTGNLSLSDILDQVWRHADETGEAYLPVYKLRQ